MAGRQPGVLFAGDHGAAASGSAFPIPGLHRLRVLLADGEQGPFQLLEGMLPDSLYHGVQGEPAISQQMAEVGSRHRREPLSQLPILDLSDSAGPRFGEELAETGALGLLCDSHGGT